MSFANLLDTKRGHQWANLRFNNCYFDGEIRTPVGGNDYAAVIFRDTLGGTDAFTCNLTKFHVGAIAICNLEPNTQATIVGGAADRYFKSKDPVPDSYIPIQTGEANSVSKQTFLFKTIAIIAGAATEVTIGFEYDGTINKWFYIVKNNEGANFTFTNNTTWIIRRTMFTYLLDNTTQVTS